MIIEIDIAVLRDCALRVEEIARFAWEVSPEVHAEIGAALDTVEGMYKDAEETPCILEAMTGEALEAAGLI